MVREDDVVVELGAGIGFMSTLVATKRKIKAVHAFEANPQLIPYIASVHAANGVKNAHVTNAILGPEAGSVPFYIREKFIASSMTKDVEGTMEEGAFVERERAARCWTANPSFGP